MPHATVLLLRDVCVKVLVSPTLVVAAHECVGLALDLPLEASAVPGC